MLGPWKLQQDTANAVRKEFCAEKAFAPFHQVIKYDNSLE